MLPNWDCGTFGLALQTSGISARGARRLPRSGAIPGPRRAGHRPWGSPPTERQTEPQDCFVQSGGHEPQDRGAQ
eukprot:15439634-Alexandrium_andersonii.AAC.1